MPDSFIYCDRAFLISALFALAAFTARSKNDPGDQEVARLKSMLLDADGNVLFDQTPISGVYELGVETLSDAKELVALYAGSGFKGEDSYTRTLPGNKGTVKVTKGTGGVFYTVRFSVVDIPAFSLNIKDANGDNEGQGGTYQKCKVCQRKWKSANTACHHEDAPAEEIPQEQEEQEEPEDEISEEEIAQLKEWIYDQDGNLIFSRSGKEDLYFIGVDFEMDAISLAGIYAGILGFNPSQYGFSGWFLPTVGQFIKCLSCESLIKGRGLVFEYNASDKYPYHPVASNSLYYVTLKADMAKLGFELAGKFWTSTEYSKDKAVVVSVDFGSSQSVLIP